MLWFIPLSCKKYVRQSYIVTGTIISQEVLKQIGSRYHLTHLQQHCTITDVTTTLTFGCFWYELLWLWRSYQTKIGALYYFKTMLRWFMQPLHTGAVTRIWLIMWKWWWWCYHKWNSNFAPLHLHWTFCTDTEVCAFITWEFRRLNKKEKPLRIQDVHVYGFQCEWELELT